jgi:cytochrome o ubiquinol oxidase subunit 3
VALNTALLLLSSITYGFAMLEMQKKNLRQALIWLAVTGCWVRLPLPRTVRVRAPDPRRRRPAAQRFLTSFFALVGTHGLHVTFGIVWLVTLMFQLKKHGLTPENNRRLMCLSMFWHFLDVVWIGVFTFVYLMGVLP